MPVGFSSQGRRGFFYFTVQFINGADAFFFLAIFGLPDGKGCSPKTAAAQVPVHHILQPVAKAARSGGGGFPVDGLIQFYHPVLDGRGPDEPGVQRIIDDGLVGAPAMRVIVFVFFDFEGPVLFFKFYGDVNIYIHVGRIVLIIFYITVAELTQALYEFPLLIHQR